MTNAAIAGAWSTWEESTSEHKRLAHAAEKVMKRWKNMTLSVPFATWVEQKAENSRLKKCAEKVVRRWLNASLAEAWATWTAKIADRSRLRELGGKIIKRWTNQALSGCFQNWLASLIENKNMKLTAKKVVARWTRSCVGITFLLWVEVVEERNDADKQNEVSAEIVVLEAQHKNAMTTLKGQLLNMEKASMGVSGLGQGTKRQQELAGSIAFFALAMWQRQAARAIKSKLQFRIQVHQKTISNLGFEQQINDKLLNQFELVV